MDTKKLPPLESDAVLVATPNVFAEIIAGRAPVSEVYRDDLVMAFMDIHPITRVHTLVVPLRAARFLHELTDDEAARMFVVGRKLAGAMRVSGLLCSGITMFLADGVAGGQEVPHTHLHVVPRFAGDGFGLSLPEGYHSNVPSRDGLDADAASLRAGPSN